MKRFNDMKTYAKVALVGSALALAAGPAAAINYYIAAKAYDKTLPDGTVVPMWGYVIDPDGTCYNLPVRDYAARLACVNALPDPVVPGPRMTVPSGQTALGVYLSNGLPEPTSIVITGQEMAYSQTNNGPTWNFGPVGGRTDPAQRVRSFGREAVANGGRQRYLWTSARDNPIQDPGSFIYHSGTHPQKQVYMGLYGAVTKDAAAGTAYPGVTYDDEVVLFYSDIDPAMNMSIAKLYDPDNAAYSDVDPYTTSIERHPTWFLVNGEPYLAVATDDADPTADIPTGVAGTTTLLRLFSAASKTHVPVLQGLHMSIHAEDGLRYGWEDTALGTSDFSPRVQTTAMLPPLKTKDATFTVPAARFAVYDGNGYMTNPSDPEDVTVGDTVGGMLRFLAPATP